MSLVSSKWFLYFCSWMTTLVSRGWTCLLRRASGWGQPHRLTTRTQITSTQQKSFQSGSTLWCQPGYFQLTHPSIETHMFRLTCSDSHCSGSHDPPTDKIAHRSLSPLANVNVMDNTSNDSQQSLRTYPLPNICSKCFVRISSFIMHNSHVRQIVPILWVRKLKYGETEQQSIAALECEPRQRVRLWGLLSMR